MCGGMADIQSAAAEIRRGDSVHIRMITGQLADSPTRGLPTRGLDISRTSQLGDWRSRGLDNSRSREWPKKTKTMHAKSQVASASCPVRESSSPRVGVSASCLATVITYR